MTQIIGIHHKNVPPFLLLHCGQTAWGSPPPAQWCWLNSDLEGHFRLLQTFANSVQRQFSNITANVIAKTQKDRASGKAYISLLQR